MLTRLRRRFIASAMGAFAAVVLILLCVINFGNYRTVTRQQDSALTELLSIEDRGSPFPAEPGAKPFDSLGPMSREVQYMLRFFSVHYSAKGRLQRVNHAFVGTVSADEASAYADAVLEKGRTAGWYQGYRYRVSTQDSGTVVLFLNSERELQSMRSLLGITAGVAGVALLILLGLSILLSSRAIAPFVRNLETQKQFITNASHELKTPLTAISASAGVLEMEYPEDEWVQGIQDQTARLSRLIGDLVTLSRLDEADPFPNKAPFSLSDAVWEAAEPFSALAQARGKHYSQSIEENITVTGDRATAQQIVSILLENAVKYTDDGGSIALTLARSGKRALLTVANTCSAETVGDVSHLFDRFYRGDTAHSGQVEGTGVGLSIAKAAAQALGGSIQAEKTPEGIRFLVRL